MSFRKVDEFFEVDEFLTSRWVFSSTVFAPNELAVKNFSCNPCINSWSDWAVGKNDDFFFVRSILLKTSSVFQSWGKHGEEKRKQPFWTLISRSFLFWKTIWRKTHGEAKKQSNEYRDPPEEMITRDTRAIFQQENSEGRIIFFATSNNEYKLRRKLRDTCLNILGLRLELEKAVKCLYNTNIWNLLWAPPLQGKICLCYSDVLHRNFGELKQSKNSNEAWGPLHRASTPHTISF